MTKAEHLAKAEANQLFADSLGTGSQPHIDWSVTALFYVAVHLIGAYFAGIGHSYTNHRHRHSAIQRDTHINGIYDDYRELDELSRDARYEAPGLTTGHIKYARECLQNVRDGLSPFL